MYKVLSQRLFCMIPHPVIISLTTQQVVNFYLFDRTLAPSSHERPNFTHTQASESGRYSFLASNFHILYLLSSSALSIFLFYRSSSFDSLFASSAPFSSSYSFCSFSRRYSSSLHLRYSCACFHFFCSQGIAHFLIWSALMNQKFMAKQNRVKSIVSSDTLLAKCSWPGCRKYLYAFLLQIIGVSKLQPIFNSFPHRSMLQSSMRSKIYFLSGFGIDGADRVGSDTQPARSLPVRLSCAFSTRSSIDS